MAAAKQGQGESEKIVAPGDMLSFVSGTIRSTVQSRTAMDVVLIPKEDFDGYGEAWRRLRRVQRSGGAA